MAILSTSFGRSLTFTVSAMAKEEMSSSKTCLNAVSPLKSIIMGYFDEKITLGTITSPRVVGKSCLIHRFLSPLLHEQIQIHRRYSILEKTCSCNRIKLNYQATKKKIESTRKHRRLGSKFCDRLHHNYVTCSKTKKIHQHN